MIKLIGMKRAVILGVVLALNLLIAAAYLFVVEPLREEEEASLGSASASVAKLSGDTQNIKAELAAFPANYARFQELAKKGFFAEQNRFDASRVLDALRAREPGLIGYNYEISAIKTLPNPPTDAAQMSLIDSRVSIEHISSVLDTSVYGLIGSLLAEFPQHIRISGFHVHKVREVTEETLDAITKNALPLTDGAVAFDWLTVVPADQPAGQQGGFRGR